MKAKAFIDEVWGGAGYAGRTIAAGCCEYTPLMLFLLYTRVIRHPIQITVTNP